MPDYTPEQQRVLDAVDSRADQLRRISRELHAHPELGYEEHLAHDLLTGVLEDEGFEVVRSAFGVGTAFKAVAGSGSPTVAVLCEYDALPALGHACGHNLIAALGIGVGVALKDALEGHEGTVMVLGSPAEERGGGGKVKLIEAGAFEGVDAAVMAHPSTADRAASLSLSHRLFNVEFFGKAAHAAGAPWLGHNALDAMIQAFSAMGLLRQQVPPSHRIHGIITHGGDSPNIIPEHTSGLIQVRAPSRAEVEPLLARVLACFEGAAQQTGCRFEYSWSGIGYEELRQNPVLAAAYQRHFEGFGGTIQPPAHGGSTDMGNVSHVLPSLHPNFKIAVADGQGNHTRNFEEAAGKPEAEEAMLQATKALAFTTLEAYSSRTFLNEMRAAFDGGVSL
ncbi:MAG: M20 family peptidase [Chloroflexi bacterium]|nr:M20 family peptidase [Chloroflexota bacterium]MQC48064.1 M20 family peptidase [Chloroflexota bacterium]